jgi:hypothetical protein
MFIVILALIKKKFCAGPARSIWPRKRALRYRLVLLCAHPRHAGTMRFLYATGEGIYFFAAGCIKLVPLQDVFRRILFDAFIDKVGF